MFDLYTSLSFVNGLDINALLACYKRYMEFIVDYPRNQKPFLQNMALKLKSDSFRLLGYKSIDKACGTI